LGHHPAIVDLVWGERADPLEAGKNAGKKNPEKCRIGLLQNFCLGKNEGVRTGPGWATIKNFFSLVRFRQCLNA